MTLPPPHVQSLTVLIIRHAEKPNEAFPGPGLTDRGEADKHALVVRGWQRAGAWAALFGSVKGADNPAYPTPTTIYAASPTIGRDGGQPTLRALETVQPLADRLQLTPVTRYGRGQEVEIAAEILGLSGVVLVCWEHKLITLGLLPALLQGATCAGVPAKWDSARFDIVLRLDRDATGWRFRQCFPLLLAGDTDQPMA